MSTLKAVTITHHNNSIISHKFCWFSPFTPLMTYLLLWLKSGAYDDPNGSHISVEVVSPLFEGKRAVQRQQMVYKAIWEELQGPVHAVDAMICKTPDE